MSLRQRILNLLNREGKPMSMQDIYTQFPDIKKTTVRGRVYENLGNGVKRIDRGLYISSQAIVEYGDTLTIVDRLREQVICLNISSWTFRMKQLDRKVVTVIYLPYQPFLQKNSERS